MPPEADPAEVRHVWAGADATTAPGTRTVRPPDERDIDVLALRACDGDELAFADLCHRFHRFIRLTAREYYAVGLAHDDLVQEGRIALLTAVSSYDPAAGVHFNGFAPLVIRRRIMSAVKQANAGKHRPLAQDRFEDPIDGGDRTLGDMLAASPFLDPASKLEAREDFARIIECLVTDLSPAELAVVVRRIDGAPLEEAGRGLGQSFGGSAKMADNALQRARRKIRRALGEAA